MNSFGTEKAVTIRYPATANLMVDSQDLAFGAPFNAGDILFTKTNAFQNGFFTRLAVTEMVLTMNIPNIIGTDLSGYQFACDISGTTSQTIMYIPNGFYNVAELIDAVAAAMNKNGSFGTVTVVQNFISATPIFSGQVAINATGGFRFSVNQPQTNFSYTLPSLLGVNTGGAWALNKRIGPNPTITFLRYLDYVSPQLTYPQDLKDANTEPSSYDVLLRYYLSSTDQAPLLDKYGYIIPFGAYPVNERRLFNPPKQIKWDNNLPVGNFQIETLYQRTGALLGGASSMFQLIETVYQITRINRSQLYSFLMTIQLSEA